MKINVTLTNHPKMEGVLTTESSQSSYGSPVLLIAGSAYGPGDLYRGAPVLIAEESGDVEDFAELFSRPLPAEPQAILEWNARVVDINTRGKIWSEDAGRYVAAND